LFQIQTDKHRSAIKTLKSLTSFGRQKLQSNQFNYLQIVLWLTTI